MRLADMREHRTYNYPWRTNENGFPENYNVAANQANIVQILDRETISTIALFYFFNNDKFTFTRFQVKKIFFQNQQKIHNFQRVFKVITMHKGTCDYVLRSLLSILKAACEEGTPEEENAKTRWSDSFKIQSSSNNSEQILYIGENNKSKTFF